MNFADIFFLYVFLPLCGVIYFVAKSTKQKNFVLLVFSLLFYAWGEPVRIVFLVLSALVNYLISIPLAKQGETKAGRWLLGLSLVFNIGMLGVFKYTDFVIENINSLFSASIPAQNLGFLLGVSFFTFRIISYMVDLYWGEVKLQKSFFNLLLFVSLFPAVVAGPIVRYRTIESQLTDRKTTLDDLTEGGMRIITGLTKKMLLANNLGLLASGAFGDTISQSSVAGTWLGVLAYSLQMYFDFSGYSDIAIGLGRVFGFGFDENFNYPFVCRTISEFWQRWHISLGSFFRDYLFYLPIFGKRRPFFSLLLVWFTTGLWHGASWNYVIWGLYFGLFIFVETLMGKKRMRKIPTPVLHIYSKLVIVLGFGIFRFENLGDLGNFFKNLVGANGNVLIDDSTVTVFLNYLFVLIAALVFTLPILPAIKSAISKMSDRIKSIAVLLQAGAAVAMIFVDTVLLVATQSSNNLFLYATF